MHSDGAGKDLDGILYIICMRRSRLYKCDMESSRDTQTLLLGAGKFPSRAENLSHDLLFACVDRAQDLVLVKGDARCG
jgi:hypothetical protein